MIDRFTHWLLFPETDDYHPFIKAVSLDEHTSYQHLSYKKIRWFPYSSRPVGYPEKPQNKVNTQSEIPQTVQ